MMFVIIVFSNDKLQEQAQRVYCGLKCYVVTRPKRPQRLVGLKSVSSRAQWSSPMYNNKLCTIGHYWLAYLFK